MICAVAIALLASEVAVAQAPAPRAPLVATARQGIDRLERRYQFATVRRDIGWGMAGVGMALIVAGALTVGYGFNSPGSTSASGYDQAAYDIVAGSATVAVGVGLAIPGIALAIQGQSEMTEVMWLMRGTPATMTAIVLPTRGGFVASWSVQF